MLVWEFKCSFSVLICIPLMALRDNFLFVNESKMESQLDELCGMVMKIKVVEEEEDISYPSPSPSPCQSSDQHEFSSKASSSATIF